MTDHIGSSAAMQHARRKSAKVSSTTGAVEFWRVEGDSQQLFRVNAGCNGHESARTLEVLLGYVRDRLDAAVPGDQPDDGSDSSINGDEAFVLGFVMHAALALAQALPILDPDWEDTDNG